jgi:predicted CxxxxCH...CXXCH cytochrome family protein
MRVQAAAIVFGLAVGCASPQPLEPGVRRNGTTWKADIAPLLAQSCGSCHSGSDPAAGFRTDDYFQVIARAHAGDASSLLLTIQSDATHAPFASTFVQLKTWVVDDELGYETSQVHGPGLMNPSDPTFHGAVASGLLSWNLSSCTQCHGTDFAGGKSGVACTTCHEGGLTSCTGCHGQPPSTGAHLAHVSGVLSKAFDCAECHTKPAVYTDVGHLHSGPGTVHFGTLASKDATPTYDPSTQTCSAVYCHGGAFTDSAATQRTPTWSGGADQAACGTCHGLPPSGHQNTGDQCVNCHSGVVDAQRHIRDVARHVNGTKDFGIGADTCTSCHGQPPTTGSHIAHTDAVHLLAAPVACADCHTVPATVDAPGHLTANAQVTITGVRATGSGHTQPAWNPETQTCTNVACHGVEQPQWGGGQEVIACGSCHGIPPATADHDPSLTLSDCVRCHASTVGPGGAIKVGGTHINGAIDYVQN